MNLEILVTITVGPDASLFRISDQGTISFKDTAPNPSSPNDSDGNGEYLITITVTDNADGFTQDIEYVLNFLTGMIVEIILLMHIQR